MLVGVNEKANYWSVRKRVPWTQAQPEAFTEEPRLKPQAGVSREMGRRRRRRSRRASVTSSDQTAGERCSAQPRQALDRFGDDAAFLVDRAPWLQVACHGLQFQHERIKLDSVERVFREVVRTLLYAARPRKSSQILRTNSVRRSNCHCYSHPTKAC